MKYHLTTHTDNNRTKFSIIETIKNARNKKRERRFREIFCLETACILMEASYQAYFPLPTTFSLRWNSNDLDYIKSTSITMDKSGQTVRRETADYTSLSKSNRRAEEISVCEMHLPDPVPVPATSETSQQKQKSDIFPLPLSSQSSSSSSFMQAAESGVGVGVGVGAGRESVLPALSASPHHTAEGATALEVSYVYIPAAVISTPKSTVSTVSRTGEETVASAVISNSPHPIPRLTSLREDRHTTDTVLDSMRITLSEIPGLPGINDNVLPRRVRGQGPANESTAATATVAVAAAAVTMSSTVDGDCVRAPTEPQQPLSPPHPPPLPHPLPSADVPPLEALDDNRVFGPKMDLPRMGLKLLSSFENKEHATFGFVATTPRPASFHPLEGEEHSLKCFIIRTFFLCFHHVLMLFNNPKQL